MPKPAHGKWETGNENGKTGQAGATQPLHPGCTCQSSVRSSSSFFLFFSFSFSCVCPFATHPLTARPGFPGIHTYRCSAIPCPCKGCRRNVCMCMCMCTCIGHVARQRQDHKKGRLLPVFSSRACVRSCVRSLTYSAVRERERERERNVFFSPGRKPRYAGSLPLTGIRSLVRSDDYMSGAVGACTHTIGAVQGLREHPYPYP